MKSGILILLCFLPSAFGLHAQDAREIIRKADEHAKGKTSTAQITIQIVRPTYTREMSIKSWSMGNSLAMVLVTAPAREKGVVYLKQNKEVWNWIPSIERNIKMPPSMMSQSWMGTDFTNDDLVKEASIIDDYTHRIMGDTLIEERSCYVIDLLPKAGSAVVWGRIRLCVEKKNYLMMAAWYYDEDGSLVNTMRSGDVKQMGGRLLPARMEMIPAGKKGQKTVLIYRDLIFDMPLEEKFFTTQNMIRVK